MEQSVGCAEWLILPCRATHRAKWNGQPDKTTLQGIIKKRERRNATPDLTRAQIIRLCVKPLKSFFYPVSSGNVPLMYFRAYCSVSCVILSAV